MKKSRFTETQIIQILNEYEFFYDTKSGVLSSIQNDHLQADCLNHDESINFKNDKIEIDTWFLKLNQDLTKSDVKKTLKKQEIPFIEEEYWGSDIIRFESGVYLDFDDRDGVWAIDEVGTVEKDESVVFQNSENFVLNGIRYFP